MLDAAQLQEFTQIGGVQHVVGGDREQVAAAGGLQRDGPDQIAVRLHGHGSMVQHQQDAPGRQVGSQQLLQHRAAHLGLETQRRHPAGAGVERPLGARLRRERVVAAVVFAHRAPELPVACPPIQPVYSVSTTRRPARAADTPPKLAPTIKISESHSRCTATPSHK